MGFTPHQSTIHWGSNEKGAAYLELVAEIQQYYKDKGYDWREARVIRVAVVMLARKLGIPVPAVLLKKAE